MKSLIFIISMLLLSSLSPLLCFGEETSTVEGIAVDPPFIEILGTDIIPTNTFYSIPKYSAKSFNFESGISEASTNTFFKIFYHYTKNQFYDLEMTNHMSFNLDDVEYYSGTLSRTPRGKKIRVTWKIYDVRMRNGRLTGNVGVISRMINELHILHTLSLEEMKPLTIPSIIYMEVTIQGQVLVALDKQMLKSDSLKSLIQFDYPPHAELKDANAKKQGSTLPQRKQRLSTTCDNEKKIELGIEKEKEKEEKNTAELSSFRLRWPSLFYQLRETTVFLHTKRFICICLNPATIFVTDSSIVLGAFDYMHLVPSNINSASFAFSMDFVLEPLLLRSKVESLFIFENLHYGFMLDFLNLAFLAIQAILSKDHLRLMKSRYIKTLQKHLSSPKRGSLLSSSKLSILLDVARSVLLEFKTIDSNIYVSTSEKDTVDDMIFLIDSWLACKMQYQLGHENLKSRKPPALVLSEKASLSHPHQLTTLNVDPSPEEIEVY